jgi:Protein of unknown function (DUF1353)
MLTTRRGFLCRLLVASASFAARPAFAAPIGRYKGRVVAEWLPKRDMKLVEPFEYIGADGTRWPVPAGTIVDGASIPQFLWSLIGGPFEDNYRDASVIHDYFCVTRTRQYGSVHRMFHEAMLTSGVSESRSWLMFQGVAQFGPRWPDPRVAPECQIPAEITDTTRCPRRLAKPPVTMETVNRQKLEEFIKRNEGKGDPKDLEVLRRTARSLP